MNPTPTLAVPALRLRSEETGSDYSIYVDAPDERSGEGPWPAVFLMDGDFLFDPAVAAARELREADQLPPVVLVGVGYGAGFGEAGNHRGRDYTPTASALEPGSGGVEPFLAFLRRTLWLEIARRHPVRSDRSVIAGHSLGALPALHALFRPDPLFNRVLASAPSLWWDDRAPLAQIAKFRDGQSSLSASLFLAVGADDTASMTGDLAFLERQLADRPFGGLGVASQKFPGRDHYTAVSDALRAGFRILLAGERPVTGAP